MPNSVDPDETAHMSRLIWICAVCKSLLLSLVAAKVKESLLLLDFTCYTENLLNLYLCNHEQNFRRYLDVYV